MKSYPSSSLFSYTQPFELKCRVLEYGMSMILCTMVSYEFSIVPYHETTYVSPCRSIALSLSSSDNGRAPSFLENYEGSFAHEEMEVEMVDCRHLEMKNLLSFLDDPFSMSISQLKERLLPTADPKIHWFWRAFGEKRISLRDIIGGTPQHFMKCKFLHHFGEDGILQREDTMIMQHITHPPYWEEWVRMIRNGLHEYLQIYAMG